MSSNFGNKIKLTVFGESHGPYIGGVIQGLDSGKKLDFEKIDAFMTRRKPHNKISSSKRREDDEFEILSGISQGKTNGFPLAFCIKNKDKRARDYSDLRNIPRPSHADFSAMKKYTFTDLNGGGHFSGRLTAVLCFFGAICKQYLDDMDIHIGSQILSIKDAKRNNFDLLKLKKEDFTGEEINDDMAKVLMEAKKNNDSVGGIVECGVLGLEAGLGEPIFDGLENVISKAIFAIPGVRGIEFGLGFASTLLYGSENNDQMGLESKDLIFHSNNSGGILGGISNSMPLIYRVAFKPTPSIARQQRSVDLIQKREETIEIKGRHDTCIVLRAPVIVEAVTAFVILDMIKIKST